MTSENRYSNLASAMSFDNDDDTDEDGSIQHSLPDEITSIGSEIPSEEPELEEEDDDDYVPASLSDFIASAEMMFSDLVEDLDLPSSNRSVGSLKSQSEEPKDQEDVAKDKKDKEPKVSMTKIMPQDPSPVKIKVPTKVPTNFHVNASPSKSKSKSISETTSSQTVARKAHDRAQKAPASTSTSAPPSISPSTDVIVQANVNANVNANVDFFSPASDIMSPHEPNYADNYNTVWTAKQKAFSPEPIPIHMEEKTTQRVAEQNLHLEMDMESQSQSQLQSQLEHRVTSKLPSPTPSESQLLPRGLQNNMSEKEEKRAIEEEALPDPIHDDDDDDDDEEEEEESLPDPINDDIFYSPEKETKEEEEEQSPSPIQDAVHDIDDNDKKDDKAVEETTMETETETDTQTETMISIQEETVVTIKASESDMVAVVEAALTDIHNSLNLDMEEENEKNVNVDVDVPTVSVETETNFEPVTTVTLEEPPMLSDTTTATNIATATVNMDMIYNDDHHDDESSEEDLDFLPNRSTIVDDSIFAPPLKATTNDNNNNDEDEEALEENPLMSNMNMDMGMNTSMDNYDSYESSSDDEQFFPNRNTVSNPSLSAPTKASLARRLSQPTQSSIHSSTSPKNTIAKSTTTKSSTMRKSLPSSTQPLSVTTTTTNASSSVSKSRRMSAPLDPKSRLLKSSSLSKSKARTVSTTPKSVSTTPKSSISTFKSTFTPKSTTTITSTSTSTPTTRTRRASTPSAISTAPFSTNSIATKTKTRKSFSSATQALLQRKQASLSSSPTSPKPLSSPRTTTTTLKSSSVKRTSLSSSKKVTSTSKSISTTPLTSTPKLTSSRSAMSRLGRSARVTPTSEARPSGVTKSSSKLTSKPKSTSTITSTPKVSTSSASVSTSNTRLRSSRLSAGSSTTTTTATSSNASTLRRPRTSLSQPKPTRSSLLRQQSQSSSTTTTTTSSSSSLTPRSMRRSRVNTSTSTSTGRTRTRASLTGTSTASKSTSKLKSRSSTSTPTTQSKSKSTTATTTISSSSSSNPQISPEKAHINSVTLKALEQFRSKMKSARDKVSTKIEAVSTTMKQLETSSSEKESLSLVAEKEHEHDYEKDDNNANNAVEKTFMPSKEDREKDEEDEEEEVEEENTVTTAENTLSVTSAEDPPLNMNTNVSETEAVAETETETETVMIKEKEALVEKDEPAPAILSTPKPTKSPTTATTISTPSRTKRNISTPQSLVAKSMQKHLDRLKAARDKQKRLSNSTKAKVNNAYMTPSQKLRERMKLERVTREKANHGFVKPAPPPLTVPTAPKLWTSLRKKSPRGTKVHPHTMDSANVSASDMLSATPTRSTPSHKNIGTGSARNTPVLLPKHPLELTTPVEPNLSTRLRHGEKRYSTCSSTLTTRTASSSFCEETSTLDSSRVSLDHFHVVHSHNQKVFLDPSTTFAENLTLLQHKGFREMPTEEIKWDPSQGITVPVSPKLHTPKPKEIKSTQQMEEEMMEEFRQHPFKARPVPQDLLESKGGDIGVHRVSVAKVTTPQPFHLHTSIRGSNSSCHTTSTTEERELEECLYQFQARPMPDLTHRPPKVPMMEKRVLTTPQPFQLSNLSHSVGKSTPLSSEERELEECAKLFRAKPMPPSTPNTPLSHVGNVTPKPLTTPQPFVLHTDLRGGGGTGEKPLTTEEKEAMECHHQFQAKPMPDLTYKPLLSPNAERKKVVTTPKPFNFVSSRDSTPNQRDAAAHRITDDDIELAKPFRAKPAPILTYRPPKTILNVTPREVTIPTPFQLSSDQRPRSRLDSDNSTIKTQLTSEELEATECAKQFQARPMPDLRYRPPKTKHVKKETKITTPEPFTFETRSTSVERGSISTHLNEDDIELAKQFQAKPMPDLSYKGVPIRGKKYYNEDQSYDGSASCSNSLTTPAPFQLATDLRGAAHEARRQQLIQEQQEEEERNRVYKAKPLPSSYSKKRAFTPQRSQKELTVPEPFPLRGEVRHAAAQSLLEEKRMQEEEEIKRKAAFVATPVPLIKATPRTSLRRRKAVPRKPLVVIEPNFQTSARAKYRSQSEQQRAQRRNTELAMKKLLEQEAKLKERREIMEQRRKSVSEGGYCFQAKPINAIWQEKDALRRERLRQRQEKQKLKEATLAC